MSTTPGHFDYGRQFYSDNYDHNDVHTDFADPSEQNWIPVPAVCRFFLNGNCRYGDFCRNSHNIQNEPVWNEPVIELPPQEDTATNTIPTTTAMNNNINSHNAPNQVIRNWIDAPEFIPRYISQNTSQVIQTTNEDEGASSQNTAISYAQIVSGNPYTEHVEQMQMYDTDTSNLPPPETTLCPYIKSIITRSDGTISCKYGDRCPYQHGDLCEICGSYCLHPTDQNQRKTHKKECMKMMEKDMEHSFAVARSKDKTCGICFEVITEKAHSEHRFGILPNCNHIFCLPCIRKWRQAKNFDSTITRACPECRVESHFVCPSMYWVDTKEEKDKLLNEYKEALGKTDCKYFNRGEGTCPFGNKCFYKHALQNGELIDVGIPQPRRRYDLHGESSIVERVILWSFLQARDDFSDLDDSLSSYSDSESDTSD